MMQGPVACTWTGAPSMVQALLACTWIWGLIMVMWSGKIWMSSPALEHDVVSRLDVDELLRGLFDDTSHQDIGAGGIVTLPAVIE